MTSDQPVLISTSVDVNRLLADPHRARMVALLADGPMCTCHLVDEMEMRQPTVSHHLKALREGGLVVAEPAGRFTYYRLLPEPLETAAAQLAALAAQARANATNRREC